jgi:hypothetical protein
MVAKERPARDIQAAMDIMVALDQQVLTLHNPVQQSTVVVEVVAPGKKEFLVGVGMLMPRAVTE